MKVSKLAGVFVVALSFAMASARAQGRTQSGAQPKAQTQSRTPQATAKRPASPRANPADVASPDALLAANYAVLSGPAGQKRDWNRFRSLYLPDARLGSVRHVNGGADLVTHSFTLEEFIAFCENYFKTESFYEKEILRHADHYSNIMQIFSTYESRHDPKDPKPFARGINGFQLFFDGHRWWIASALWQGETPDAPVPEEFLPKATGGRP